MNIAEILKYCPKGTNLYSPIYGNVILNNICLNEKFPIIIKDCKGYEHLLTEHGYYEYNIPELECVLFPSKDQRDWNKFRLPVKKGDIMMSDNRAFIISDEYEITCVGSFHKYICGIADTGAFKVSQSNHHWTSKFYIPASEEAKKELFDKMAEAGYKWNADTLELEKIEPKFKEGDVIIDDQGTLCLVSKLRDDDFITIVATLYTNGHLQVFTSNIITRHKKLSTLASTTNRNKLFSALAKAGYKYDKEQRILVKQEFKPFDKVLVRKYSSNPWKADIYLESIKDVYHHYRCTSDRYRMCIPYEGNEYLLGTTDSPICTDKKE